MKSLSLKLGIRALQEWQFWEKKKNWDKVQSISTEENLAHGYKKFIIWA